MCQLFFAGDLQHVVQLPVINHLSEGIPPLPGNDLRVQPANTGGDGASQIQRSDASGAGRRILTRNNSKMVSEDFEDEGSQDYDDDDDDDDDEDGEDNGSTGQPARVKRRRAGSSTQQRKGMMGRFSGRLPTKDDEKALADECKKLAPYLGPPIVKKKAGTAYYPLETLPKIVRAIASGDVRKHLEKWYKETESLKSMCALMGSSPEGSSLLQLHGQINSLQSELEMKSMQMGELQRDLGDAQKSIERQHRAQQQMQTSVVQPQTVAAIMPGVIPQQALMVAQAAVIPHTHSGAVEGLQPSLVTTTAAPQTVNAPTMTVVAVPPMQQQQQQQQQQSGATLPMMIHSASSAQLAQQLQAASVPQTMVTMPPVSRAPSVALTGIPDSSVPDRIGAGSGGEAPAVDMVNGLNAAAPAAAASNLAGHAQQLAAHATLHAHAKVEAANQAQALAQQAQQHAQASVQAAHQAEQLKTAIASITDPDQTPQLVASVHNLEAAAQMHAEITTNVVAQARGLQEKAQAHEHEEVKAIKQATVLQAHAESLHVQAAQIEASAPMSELPPVAVSAPQNIGQQTVTTPHTASSNEGGNIFAQSAGQQAVLPQALQIHPAGSLQTMQVVPMQTQAGAMLTVLAPQVAEGNHIPMAAQQPLMAATQVVQHAVNVQHAGLQNGVTGVIVGQQVVPSLPAAASAMLHPGTNNSMGPRVASMLQLMESSTPTSAAAIEVGQGHALPDIPHHLDILMPSSEPLLHNPSAGGGKEPPIISIPSPTPPV